VLALDKRLNLDDFADLICSDRFGPAFGRVRKKFVKCMLKGIQRKQSVNLTEIAKSLDEGIRLHATQKRLSRNLLDPLLCEKLCDRLLRMGAKTVTADTRLIVHLYTIEKAERRTSKKDQNVNTRPETGYRVCEIIANDNGLETYTPLLARVWSDNSPGFKSDLDEIRKAIHQVLAATQNQGMLCFDEMSISVDIMLSLMEDSRLDFLSMIVRGDPEVFYRNELCSVKQLVKDIETPYGQTMFKLVPKGMISDTPGDVDIFIHAGTSAVRLPKSNRHLNLIALKSKQPYLDQEVETPVFTSRNNLRSRKALMGIVESLLSIQDVIGTHGALRQTFDPSNFRVLSYERLKLLLTLMQGVLYFETTVTSRVSVKQPKFAAEPHPGELERTYLLPVNGLPEP
tara:strand:+ start:117 stop:1313 length:1197 start_codon:yes stop_codon:yes gene_type:complete